MVAAERVWLVQRTPPPSSPSAPLQPIQHRRSSFILISLVESRTDERPEARTSDKKNGWSCRGSTHKSIHNAAFGSPSRSSFQVSILLSTPKSLRSVTAIMKCSLMAVAFAAEAVTAFHFVANMPGVDSSLLRLDRRQQSGGSNPGGPATCPGVDGNQPHVPAPGITAQFPYNNAKNGTKGNEKGGY
ncbi:hypothetical protein BDZ45DRAFT_15276 [Acephala macrosclerotiorum]|nr:hypothetical protein BDZ45DRAFT_15276 [Acephala macrosclerotiorum]